MTEKYVSDMKVVIDPMTMQTKAAEYEKRNATPPIGISHSDHSSYLKLDVSVSTDHIDFVFFCL
jgi:hypothetical protein